MLDDLAGKRTGERVQILRERRGLSRPVLARLVGMSASWPKGIERGTRLPPRLPLLVKLAEALAVGDVAALAVRSLRQRPDPPVMGARSGQAHRSISDAGCGGLGCGGRRRLLDSHHACRTAPPVRMIRARRCRCRPVPPGGGRRGCRVSGGRAAAWHHRRSRLVPRGPSAGTRHRCSTGRRPGPGLHRGPSPASPAVRRCR
jgi:DNA-binding XRE family transcriptional regulator